MLTATDHDPDTVPKESYCPRCHGAGTVVAADGHRVPCDRCGGKGWVPDEPRKAGH